MNAIMKKLSTFRAAALMASMVLVSSNSAFAQSKPKGKPWNAPESAIKAKNPVKPDDNTLKQGKDVFAQHCKSCHGAKGKGDGPKAEKIDISCGDFSSSEVVKKTDGELFWKTTEGRKPMPSFKEKLSDQERWMVVLFLRSLK